MTGHTFLESLIEESGEEEETERGKDGERERRDVHHRHSPGHVDPPAQIQMSSTLQHATKNKNMHDLRTPLSACSSIRCRGQLHFRPGNKISACGWVLKIVTVLLSNDAFNSNDALLWYY